MMALVTPALLWIGLTVAEKQFRAKRKEKGLPTKLQNTGDPMAQQQQQQQQHPAESEEQKQPVSSLLLFACNFF